MAHLWATQRTSLLAREGCIVRKTSRPLELLLKERGKTYEQLTPKEREEFQVIVADRWADMQTHPRGDRENASRPSDQLRGTFAHICRRLYVAGLPPSEIALKVGLSESTVSRIIREQPLSPDRYRNVHRPVNQMPRARRC